MAKTLIAVPCFDMVHADFMYSIVNLRKPEDTSWTMVKNTLVHDARNLIAASAAGAGFERVMWFDSDMVFTPETLMTLSKDMDETGADIVTGLYYTRRPPDIKPVVYRGVWFDGKKSGAENILDFPDGLSDCEAAGFGCCLTTVEILDRVGQKFGSPFDPLPTMGEDISFCWRAKQCGAKILLDSNVKCGHIGMMVYGE